MPVKLKAYAKINLFLTITGKREDGYHLVDSVMQSINLADDITIGWTDKPGIHVTSDRTLPKGFDNTASKAASLFFDTTGRLPKGVAIHIKKRIPLSAGLGGGSADAAAVLHGLNALTEAGLSLDKLCSIGLQIGADLPFCLQGGTARVQGIGEEITPLSPLPDCSILIIKNSEKSSTKDMYALFDENPVDAVSNGILDAVNAGDLRGVAGNLYNVFEHVQKDEQTGKIKNDLKSFGGLGTVLTGSGPSVLGIFSSMLYTFQTVAALTDRYREVYLSRPVSQGIQVQFS